MEHSIPIVGKLAVPGTLQLYQRFFFANESNSFLVGQVNRVLIALGLTNWSHTGTLHAVIKVKSTLGLIISPVFVETDVA